DPRRPRLHRSRSRRRAVGRHRQPGLRAPVPERREPDRPYGRPGQLGKPPPQWEIVGVAADAAHRPVREPRPPPMYTAFDQFGEGSTLPYFRLVGAPLSVRASAGDPVLLSRGVAAAITSIQPDLALTFRPLADQVNASLTQERIVAMLSGFFGLL